MSAGIYLHIPFCKSRCSYCDFATEVYRDSDAVERYVDALDKEISNFKFHGFGPTQALAGFAARISDSNGQSPDTIYFGGGTPSLLSPDQVERILETVHSKFNVTATAEITMEMNPATVTTETLAGYRLLGVNRASFGVQTFNDPALKLLARGHDADDARKTFAMLRAAGFENISFDLIAGLPSQTLEDWQRNLDEAVQLAPEHISLYLLEIHEGTPLAEQVRSGRQPTPDDDLAAEMYEVMLDRLAAAGYEQYEISSFSKPGYQSRHNTKYWRLEPVFGFGVSAHSFDGRERYANERDTARYVELMEKAGSAEVTREEIDERSERAFLGLRLENGIDLEEYSINYGVDLTEKYRNELADIKAAGVIETVDGRLRLTQKGKLFSNEVFAIFV